MIPKWAQAVIGAGVLLIVILLSGLKGPEGPDGVELINNLGHYNQVVKDAADLVTPRFAAADAGNDLTDEDRKALREAVKLFAALNSFKPSQIGPYLGAGKAYTLLGDDENAERCLQQLLNNVPLYADNETGHKSEVEAKYLISGIRFRQQKYNEAYAFADEAVKAVPDAPNYLVARASAAIQIKQIKQAKEDVAAALTLDPNHKKALQLATLLKAQDAPRALTP